MTATTSPPVRVREVFEAWWPLAASWLLMGLELPAVSAMMARLPEPTLSLAAYGGVVFPLAMLIESPIIMLLSASTALSRDLPSYRVGRAFMLALGGGFTALHALVAFTPLYDLVAGGILGVPHEVLEPGRVGMRIMTPWTIAIAYRRFQQGVLIRFGHSRAVGTGTAVRLGTNLAVLAAGYLLGSVPGIVVGTLAVAAGVTGEAIYAGIVVHPVLRREVSAVTPVEPPLTARAFARFYAPLGVTPFLMLLSMPLASGTMTRLPRALESLAVWPVVNGLVFTLRSVGFALNEVVVAQLDRPRALPALRRFAWTLAATTTGLLLVLAATPLGRIWLERVSALEPGLAALAGVGLWLSLPMPGLSALQSFYQGAIVHSHRTRAVTESMAAFLMAAALVLGAGVSAGRWVGLYVAVVALVAANLAQLAWLAWRARVALRALAERDGDEGARDAVPATG